MSKDKDKEIQDYNNGDKVIKDHQEKEGKTSYSKWVQEQKDKQDNK